MSYPLAPGRILRSISACECKHLELASKEIADEDNNTLQNRIDILSHDRRNVLCGTAHGYHETSSLPTPLAQEKVTFARRTLLDLSELINKSSSIVKDGQVDSQNAADIIIQYFMLKAISHYTASRSNFFIWKGDRARKYLVVLRWVYYHHPEIVLRFSIRVLNKVDASESGASCRQLQMATSLALFELFQNKMTTQYYQNAEEERHHLETYLSLLETFKKTSCVANIKQRTRLEMAKYEAFIATSCLVAFLLSRTKINDAEISELRFFIVLADSITAILDATEEWQMCRSNPSSHFLIYAVHHLRRHLHMHRKLFGMKQKKLRQAGIEMMLYSWTKSAMLLCSRSDVMLKLRTDIKEYQRSKLSKTVNDTASSHLRRIPTQVENMIFGCKSHDVITNEINVRNLCIVVGQLFKTEVTKAFPSNKIALDPLIMCLAETLRILTRGGLRKIEELVLGILRSCLCSPTNGDKSLESSTSLPRAMYQAYADVLVLSMMRAVSRSPAYIRTKDFEHDSEMIGKFILRSCGQIDALLVVLQCRQPVLVTVSLRIARAILTNQDRFAECFGNIALYRKLLTPPILQISVSTNMSYLHDQVKDLLKWLDHSLVIKIVVDTLSYGPPAAKGRVLEVLFQFISSSSVTECHLEEHLIRIFAQLWRAQSALDQEAKPAFIASPSDWTNLTSSREENKVYTFKKKQAQSFFTVKDLCQMMTPCQSRIIVQVLLGQMLGSPRDGIYLQMLREALQYVNNSDFPGTSVLVNQVFQYLAKRLLQKLQDLDGYGTIQSTRNPSYRTESLLFARLCPFVVLRIVPEKMFWFPSCTADRSQSLGYGSSLAGSGGDIRHDVFARMITTLNDANNVKEINMLSVEILLKFQVEYGFERVARTLEVFVDNANNPHETGEHTWWSQRMNDSSVDSDQLTCGPVLATSLVYYLNRLVQREGRTVLQRLAACSDYVVPRIVILLLGIMSRPISHKANELECTTSSHHIVEGCVCCLAALNQLCLEVTSASSSNLVNVVTLCEIMVLLTSYGYPKLEIAREMSTRAISQLIDQLGVLERNPLSIQARICCCKALLYAIKHVKDLALSLIFRIVVQGFLAALETTDHDPDVEEIMLQVLYVALAKAQPDFKIIDVGPTIRIIDCVISRRLVGSANRQIHGIMISILKLLHSSARCNEYLDGGQAPFK